LNSADGGAEVLQPCVYELQVKVGSGAWITIKAESVSAVTSATTTYSCSSTDSVDFRVALTDSSFVPAGTFIQGSYSQVSGLVGGIAVSDDGVRRIVGKTTSAYEREDAFRVTGDSPYTVRITRLTPDSTSNYLQNATTFQAVSVVTEEKFRYPGSVLAGISVDATQFSSVPTRAYDCKMLRIKVPNNYNPLTREYVGFWDGGFKVAWSDNPAWCFYDLLTNKRYGLGERIPESFVDKASLYQIGQYCDEYVPDGQGGYEPRFTCNVYINNQAEAYRIISDMATVFRGITYWATGNIVPVQDSPKDPVYAFNNTNVVDGMFTYQSSDVNTRYNAVSVTYNDPSNFYRQGVEYVADDDVIAETGYINHTSVVAFGCTSKSMARRVGKWLLYTNSYETDAVTFSAGIEGIIPKPGDVIKISDSLRATERRGGRVKEFLLEYYEQVDEENFMLTGSLITLDAEMTFVSGMTYTFTALDVDGKLVETTFSTSGTTNQVIVPVLPKELAKDSIFIIADNNIAPELFRVTGVTEAESAKYEISAVSYNPSKYAKIERDERLTFNTLPSNYVGTVTDVVATEILYSDGVSVKSKVRVDWKTPNKAVTYDVYVVAPDGSRFESLRQKATSYEVVDTLVGDYVFTVWANDVLGHQSQGYTETISILGKTANPTNVTGLAVKALNGGGLVVWDSHPDLDVTVGGSIIIKYTDKVESVSWEDGVVVATAPGNATQVVVPLMQGTYTAKAIDEGGRYSVGFASANSAYTDVLNTNAMATLTEHPLFSGTKTNLTVASGTLRLLPVDDTALAGTYLFSDVIDLTDTYTVRAFGNVKGYAAVQNDTINSRLDPINTWTRFNGEIINSGSLKLLVSATTDDPYSSGAVWGEWSEFVVSDYTARGFRFKVEMAVTSAQHAMYVTELAVSLDAVDRVAGGENVSIPSYGQSIAFDGAFSVTPAIAINIDNMVTGDYHRITNKSASGFTVKIYNSAGVAKAGQIDWVAKGYGRKA
jgi:predicted phage tail protein